MGHTSPTLADLFGDDGLGAGHGYGLDLGNGRAQARGHAGKGLTFGLDFRLTRYDGQSSRFFAICAPCGQRRFY